MKNKSIDDWIALCATQKQKLTIKNRELRKKDAQIVLYETQLTRQLKKLDGQIQKSNSLTKRVTKKSQRIELLDKQLKDQLTTIQELKNDLAKLSAENKSLQQELVEKNKTQARLNQAIIEANRSGTPPVIEAPYKSPIQSLLDGMEDGTVGTHQIPGGVAGALG